LIQCAKDGEFNLVSVEDEVIERALLIMKRRRKRSPLILDDDPDVRKSTVEAIVRRIASGEAPGNLKNRRILLLDLDKLLAIQDRTELEKQGDYPLTTRMDGG
jgi:ATP-dependent Clp protease ATP-binding subunit ClpA